MVALTSTQQSQVKFHLGYTLGTPASDLARLQRAMESVFDAWTATRIGDILSRCETAYNLTVATAGSLIDESQEAISGDITRTTTSSDRDSYALRLRNYFNETQLLAIALGVRNYRDPEQAANAYLVDGGTYINSIPGSDGTDGTDAISLSVTTSFTIPAEGSTQTQEFDTVNWVSIGQIVFFSDGTNYGHFTVTNISSNTLTLENTFGETTGTAIAIGGKLSPSGTKGVDGVDPFSLSVTTSFTIPVQSSTQTQEFDGVQWIGVGQVVFFSDGTNYGYFTVTNISANTLTLENTYGETTGTTIAIGGKLSPSGARGTDGVDGADGAGITWLGAWDSATAYVEFDAVEYNGSSYIANTGNTNKIPGTDPEWDLWVEKGDTGSTGAVSSATALTLSEQGSITSTSANEIDLVNVNNSLQFRLESDGTTRTIGYKHPDVNAQTGTTYTLALTDDYSIVTMDNASANTLTIPTNASVAFPVGSMIEIWQKGAGTTTITGDTGVTLNGVSAGSTDMNAQYSAATLRKIATDTWLIAGGIADVA